MVACVFHGFLFVYIDKNDIYVNFKQDSASTRADKIFKELDINGDGELDQDEFVKGCMDDGDLLRMLNNGGSDCRRGSVDAYVEG